MVNGRFATMKGRKEQRPKVTKLFREGYDMSRTETPISILRGAYVRVCAHRKGLLGWMMARPLAEPAAEREVAGRFTKGGLSRTGFRSVGPAV
jgi:hypothetical protein